MSVEDLKARLRALNLDEMEANALADIRSGKKTKRDAGIKILRAVHGIKRSGVSPEDLIITKVPVIPAGFRPYTVEGETFLPGDANELYADLIKAKEIHQEVSDELGPEHAKESRDYLRKAVRAAYGYDDSPNVKIRTRRVSGLFQKIVASNPKQSWVQGKLLSKPQDQVGRAVISPDPSLGMDQLKIPEDMAWETANDVLEGALASQGISKLRRLQMIKERHPVARTTLVKLLETSPVVYARAPAWHRQSFISGYATMSDGNNIRISPLVTAGLNADYDGDEVRNQVLACIHENDLQGWRMSYHNIDLHELRFPSAMGIPTLENSRIYLFDLEDFPHDGLLSTKEGIKGRIDFHAVTRKIKVLAYDEKKVALEWAPVAAWSKHYSREIEIVDTHNNYQLVTDDDPRAVYGTAAGKLEMARFTPTEALEKNVLVPRAKYIPVPKVTFKGIPGCNSAQKGRFCPRLMKEEVILDSLSGWMLGAMAGDGWVSKSKGKPVRADFADNEGFNIKKLTEAFNSIMREEVKSTDIEMDARTAGRYGSTVSYRFSSVNLAQWLRPLIGGERDDKSSGSANKHLPPFFLATDREFREGLLCGLLDTDGSIAISNGKKKPQLMVNMSSTSLRLVQETKLLAASLGISSRITPGKTPKGGANWLLSFSNHEFQAWGAPYMAHEGKLKKLRSVPSIKVNTATAKYDLVPIPLEICKLLRSAVGCPKITAEAKASGKDLSDLKNAQALYQSLVQSMNSKHSKFGVVSRSQALRAIEAVGRRTVEELPGGSLWLSVVANDDVTWERVVGVQYTGIKEDGYDLTVPGYETFMSADGIILSNTMAVHLPVLPEAVKDAKEKLLPSRMLFSIRDRDKTLPTPKHESLLGLFSSQQAPLRDPVRVTDPGEALKMYESGKLGLDDHVEYD